MLSELAPPVRKLTGLHKDNHGNVTIEPASGVIHSPVDLIVHTNSAGAKMENSACFLKSWKRQVGLTAYDMLISTTDKQADFLGAHRPLTRPAIDEV